MTAEPVDVRGVQRHSNPAVLLWLAERVMADHVRPVHAIGLWDAPAVDLDRCPVTLVREPGNPKDVNAVKVVVPAIADYTDDVDMTHVGYVPRGLAATWAGRLKAGEVPVAWVGHIRPRTSDDLSNPGLTIYVDWP